LEVSGQLHAPAVLPPGKSCAFRVTAISAFVFTTQSPRISTHLMMTEQAETCIAVANFKVDLILNFDIVAWWTVKKTVKQMIILSIFGGEYKL
jgi:hypothetical protein